MGYRAAGTNLASKLKTKRTARIGVALLVFGMLALITQAQFEPIDATVVRVIDGDTIRVRVQGKEYTVRLIGVDTPETVHPTKTVQHFGAEASAYTKAALEAKTVTLEADPTGDTRDRYAVASLRPPGRPKLQRPVDPRGIRSRHPRLPLLEAGSVYPP